MHILATIIDKTTNSTEEGTIEIFEEYSECIDGLEGFDYIWLVSYFHLNSGFKTKIKPQPRPDAVNQPPESVGLFCSRAPHRPNPIGKLSYILIIVLINVYNTNNSQFFVYRMCCN